MKKPESFPRPPVHRRARFLSSHIPKQWVLRDEVVTSALIGASRPEQITENVQAVHSTAFTPSELAEIDAILADAPRA